MKTAAIVFENANVDREDLVQDLEEPWRSISDINSEELSDEELQEAWTQHGFHAGSWMWERVRTDSSAPAWGWISFTDTDDIKSVKCEIAEIENTPVTQMISRELIEYNLECLKTGLRAFEAGQSVWVNWDDDGTHLGIQVE